MIRATIVVLAMACGCGLDGLIVAAPYQAVIAADRYDRREHAAENKERAATLIKTAVDAVRAGNCAAVGKLDAQVRALDVTYHGTVFVEDIEIGLCLRGLQRAAEQRLPACMQQRHEIFERA